MLHNSQKLFQLSGNVEIKRSEQQWRQQLTPEQFYICREKGTEPPFSGKYHNHKEPGLYRCVCCKNPLFHSQHKFDSGTGWPSFSQPYKDESVSTATDLSHGMRRTEVLCAACGAHLGHVFEDGIPPNNTRYCINSISLEFDSEGKSE